MHHRKPQILSVIKEVSREERPVLNLDRAADLKLLIAVLRVTDRYGLSLDGRAISKIVISEKKLKEIVNKKTQNPDEILVLKYISERATIS